MNITSNLPIKKKIFSVVSLIYILYCAFPLFSDIVTIPVQYVCISVTLILACLYPKSIYCKPALWLLLYLFILFIDVSLDRYIHLNGVDNSFVAPMNKLLIQAAWILPSVQMAHTVSRPQNIQLAKIIGYGALIILVVSFVYIIPLLEISANVMRTGALETNIEFRLPGLPNYTLMHSYILMLPGICLAIKSSKTKWRIIFAFVGLLFYYIILKTGVSTSIGLASAFLVFTFLVLKENPQRTRILVVIAVLCFIIAYYSGLVLALVDAVTPFFEGTDVEGKLRDLHDSIVLGEATGGTITHRAELHDLSKNSFLENPLFGKGTGDVGRHSHVLDILGASGLVAFIPFAMIIWSTMKMYVPNTTTKVSGIMLYTCFVIAAIYLYSKGIFGSTGWLFMNVLGPSLVVAVCHSDKQKCNCGKRGPVI